MPLGPPMSIVKLSTARYDTAMKPRSATRGRDERLPDVRSTPVRAKKARMASEVSASTTSSVTVPSAMSQENSVEDGSAPRIRNPA